MMHDNESVCADCKEPLDENDGRWSNVLDDMVCDSCIENACNYASVVYLIDPDEVTTVMVTDLEVFEQYGEHIDEPVIKRTYTHTSAWRGYYVTTVEDYVEVEGGWITGDYGDYIGARKRTFNDWAQDLVEGKVECPVRMALAFDPTSNVFSTAATVYVHKDNLDAFNDWISEATREALHDSLA